MADTTAVVGGHLFTYGYDVLYSHPDGCPRARFPDLLDVLPEENFLLWQMYGVCLCGCGMQTKARHTASPYIVNYWVRGHLSALRGKHGLTKVVPRTAARTAAQVRENMSRTVDGTAILEMVREHIDTHFDGSLSAFCRSIGMQHSGLVHNYNRNHRMTKARAKLLLEAIGEQPHPSLMI